MVVNHQERFVFIALPRTASVSMQTALLRIPGSRRVGDDRHTTRIPEGCEGYTIIAGVRNPYAREWSHYRRHLKYSDRNHTEPTWSFERYIRDHQARGFDPPQSRKLAGLRIDHLLRFEELPDCFHALPFVPDDLRLPHLNRAGGNWREGYTQQTADLVYQWAACDFAEYGYDRESWK